jgi:hypothetical protein
MIGVMAQDAPSPIELFGYDNAYQRVGEGKF